MGQLDQSKYCRYCACDHPVTQDYWYFNKNRPHHCKIKRKDQSQTEKSKEKNRLNAARYYEENKDKVRNSLRGNREFLDRCADRRRRQQEDPEWVARQKAYTKTDEFKSKRNTRLRKKSQMDSAWLEKKRAYARTPEAKAKRNAKLAELRKTEPWRFLAKNLRDRLRKAIKGNYKSGSAVRDLGCSVDYLKVHLETQFRSGMSWQNYGNKHGQWSIDHIIPLSSFDLTDREQCLKACHYTNLQPLWQCGPGGNASKGRKLT